MTRGESNFNPGNIRKVPGATWEGQSDTQTDPDFVQFTDVKWGIRAIAKILLSYEREGIDTIRNAIARWAPSTENDTSAYVNDVCQRCSIGPDDVVQFSAMMLPLVSAIIVHENGSNPYNDAQVNQGILLA